MRTHGILDPAGFAARFALERTAPSSDLAHVVDRFWAITWDLRGQPPHAQETLPYPAVHLVVGAHRPGVHGPRTARFVASLEGTGWVLGVKFRPAGFRALADRPMAALVDVDDVPLPAMFGPAGAALDRDVRAGATMPARIARVEAFLRARAAAVDPTVALVDRLVATVEADRGITKVAQLAARARMPVRRLERLFREYVGVPPKWVIRRFRVHEAAARVAAGEVVEWARLAQELGYADQAHFIREFKAQIGRTPARYAALVRPRRA